jgi:hypothetical protein
MSRGPGRLERRLRQELERRPDGTPLRVLVAMAYAVSPAALTASQLTAVRQVLTRLAARGEIAAKPALGGAKLWHTRAADDDEAARSDAEAEAARGRAEERRWSYFRDRRHHRHSEDFTRPSPTATPDPDRLAILARVAKLARDDGLQLSGRT